jgi:hypothetical protein
MIPRYLLYMGGNDLHQPPLYFVHLRLAESIQEDPLCAPCFYR